MNFQIISDSSCDLTKEQAIEKNIRIVPFYVSFDNTNEYREGVDISVQDFYRQMVEHPNIYPKSSLPSVQDYLDVFTPYVEIDIPIICICITQNFSGSYNSARIAADMLLEQFPDAKITVIDAMGNTALQGLITLEAARMAENQLSYDAAVEKLYSIRESGRIIFTIGNIDYLRHGGRIGRLAGLAAATLGIKPLILLKNGEIFPAGISRSRTKAKQKVITYIKEHFEGLKDAVENYTFAIGYGYDYEEAKLFRDELASVFTGYTNIPVNIPLRKIGATIAVHTGPYALGVAFVRKYDAPAFQAGTAMRMVIANSKT